MNVIGQPVERVRPGQRGQAILGACVLLGLVALGWLLADAALRYREYERVVTVKGLSEREYPADVVIWPIQFTVASNGLEAIYQTLDEQTTAILEFLKSAGIQAAELSTSAPAITDKSAQQYGGQNRAEFRYTASRSVTVYSDRVDAVRAVMGRLSELGRGGIVFTDGGYQGQTEYLFTRLNAVKPEMIEEATRNAREVAQKFAEDSQSTLGKIRSASQGQFSIRDRDRNTPHIKNVRVVSTITYYLSD